MVKRYLRICANLILTGKESNNKLLEDVFLLLFIKLSPMLTAILPILISCANKILLGLRKSTMPFLTRRGNIFLYQPISKNYLFQIGRVFTQYGNSNFEHSHLVEFRFIDEYNRDKMLKYEKHYSWALPS